MWSPEREGSATAEIDGQIAEIDENLQRRTLDAIERAALDVQRSELTRARDTLVSSEDKPRQPAEVSKGGRGKKGGVVEARAAIEAAAASNISPQLAGKLSARERPRGRPPGEAEETARKIGISDDCLRRSKRIDAHDPEAKARARELGVHKTHSALLDAARQPYPAQIEALDKRAAKPAGPSGSSNLLAQMAEISENVDRRSLSVLDRSALIVRYVELVKQHDALIAAPQPTGQNVRPVKGSRQRNAGNQPGATSLAAEKFGVSTREVRRALATVKPKATKPKPAPEVDHDLLRLREGFDALAAEIAENLHRRELPALERDNLRAEWVRLREASTPLPAQDGQATRRDGRKKGPQHAQSGLSQTARDLGVPRPSLVRSLKVAALPPETKARAVELAELIARRVEMIEARKQVEARASDVSRQPAAKLSVRGRPEGRKAGGVKQTARDLGVPEQRVRRSLAIAGLAPEAKAKAADLGLASNRAALL